MHVSWQVWTNATLVESGDDATRIVTTYPPTGGPTTRPYTAAENAAADARAAETAAATNAQTLRDKATAALAGNATYLALATPSNAQVAAQVKALTRQVNALIRLEVRALTDVSDT